MTLVAARSQVTHVELQRAWQALKTGAFRDHSVARDHGAAPQGCDARSELAADPAVFSGPVVVVAGCHGWAGTSTTALLLAEGYARRGAEVRVVDAASAARSGFSAAAATEHGLDDTGRWRLGSRGQVAVHRSAGHLTSFSEVSLPPAVPADTVTVIDVGWPIADLLASGHTHWLPQLLQRAPLLLTGRASVPGLRHVEVTLESLPPSARPYVLLLGASRRWPRMASGDLLLAAERDERVHLVPEHGDLAAAGLTPAALPRQVIRVGDQLADLLTQLTTPGIPLDPPTTTTAVTPHDPTHRKGNPS